VAKHLAQTRRARLNLASFRRICASTVSDRRAARLLCDIEAGILLDEHVAEDGPLAGSLPEGHRLKADGFAMRQLD